MWKRYGDYLESVGGKEDTTRSVTYQMDVLKKVGFHDVDILHKNSCFAAFGAVKA